MQKNTPALKKGRLGPYKDGDFETIEKNEKSQSYNNPEILDF